MRLSFLQRTLLLQPTLCYSVLFSGSILPYSLLSVLRRAFPIASFSYACTAGAERTLSSRSSPAEFGAGWSRGGGTVRV